MRFVKFERLFKAHSIRAVRSWTTTIASQYGRISISLLDSIGTFVLRKPRDDPTQYSKALVASEIAAKPTGYVSHGSKTGDGRFYAYSASAAP